MAESCPTEPIPSKAAGWYVGAGSGRSAGFTSQERYAARRPVQTESVDKVTREPGKALRIAQDGSGYRVVNDAAGLMSRFRFPGSAMATYAAENDAVLGWVSKSDLTPSTNDALIGNVTKTDTNQEANEMTAKGKVVTAQVTAGTSILLRGDDLGVAHRKTGAVTATVESVETVKVGRRSRYVFNTDKGRTISFAPSQTHWLAKAEAPAETPEPVTEPESEPITEENPEPVSNFLYMAEHANTESARAYWTAKAKG